MASYIPSTFDVPLTVSNAYAPARYSPELTPQMSDPIQIVEYRQPVAMWAGSSVWGQPTVIYDMGQNIVGWCSLSVVNTNGTASAGEKVILRHAEALKLDAGNYGAFGPNQADIFTDNLWEATQTDTNIIGAATNQQFHPHFTYHGFRYVEVSAPPAIVSQLTTNSIVGCVIHSKVPFTGAFSCYDTNFANPAVDRLLTNNPVSRLMTNALWGIRGNLQGVFTACTQRGEREGYMYDEHIISQTACFDVDMAAFLTKWIPDMRDAQAYRGDGGFTTIAPFDNLNLTPIKDTDPGAQAAGVIFPWRMYQNYGDTRVLTEQYRAATNWVSYMKGRSPGYLYPGLDMNIVDGKSADWAGDHPYRWKPSTPEYIGSTTRINWGTAWYALGAEYVARMSQVLAQEAESKCRTADADFYKAQYTNYADLAAHIRQAYMGLSAYIGYDEESRIVDFFLNTQADCLMGLAHNMVPEDQRANLMEILLNKPQLGINKFNNYYGSSGHLSTGYYTSPRAMLELSREGRTDIAYKIVMNAEFPSWTYSVTNGSTTCWEAWNTYLSGPKHPDSPTIDRGYYDEIGYMMCSFNHLILGAVGEWVWTVVAGLNPDDANPGFKNAVIKPEPGGSITNALGLFNSIHGPFACSWTNDVPGAIYHLDVTVPPNSTASVYLPSNAVARVTECGLGAECPVTNSSGVTAYYFTNFPRSWPNGALVLQIGSGSYKFKSNGITP
jgi:alpha-L-rhamnosidase